MLGTTRALRDATATVNHARQDMAPVRQAALAAFSEVETAAQRVTLAATAVTIAIVIGLAILGVWALAGSE